MNKARRKELQRIENLLDETRPKIEEALSDLETLKGEEEEANEGMRDGTEQKDISQEAIGKIDEVIDILKQLFEDYDVVEMLQEAEG